MKEYNVELTTITTRTVTIRAASRESATSYARTAFGPKFNNTTLQVNILSEKEHIPIITEE